jgi:hypothetical protein
VADAHNRRIVHLRHAGGSLAWAGAAGHDADVLTSLETDQWGNLYAAAPHQGVVRKFAPDLEPVAELRGALSHPRSFHVPFANVRDHRDGSVARVGQAQAVSVDQWSDASGLRLWNLGVEVSDLGVVGGESPAAHFTLTDRAEVTLEIADAASGSLLARRAVGPMAAGLHTLPITPEDLRSVAGTTDLVLRVAAASSYPDGPSDVAQAAFQASGSGVALLPSRPVLLGNTPNPVQASTRIAFVLPASSEGQVSLRLFDAVGRRVRSFERGFAPGLNEVVWDGTDDRGQSVRAGVYFYRLEVGAMRFTRRMVRVP